jgi:hypothetical protein
MFLSIVMFKKTFPAYKNFHTSDRDTRDPLLHKKYTAIKGTCIRLTIQGPIFKVKKKGI